LDFDPDIGRLLRRQFRQLDPELVEMQRRHLLVEVLGQHVDPVLVFAVIDEELDLRQDLIGEGGAHDEAWMAGGAAEIDEPPLGQHDEPLAVGEDDFVDLRLDLFPRVVPERRDLNLAVEMADVADDGAVLHPPHVIEGDDVDVAGGSDKNVADGRDIVHRRDLIALHRRLQRADRVDLGHQHTRPLAAQARRRALADIAEAGNHGGLAGHHHVGGALDAVDQTLAHAVEIVEFRLGDAVVDVEGGHFELARLHHLVEPVHAGRRLLGDAAHVLQQLGIFVVQQLGGVAAVVEHHVGRPVLGPAQRLLDAPLVFFLGLALPGEDGNAARGDGRGGVILCREDIAGAPAHAGAQLHQCLDQHRRLDGHVQAAGDARAGQRLLRAVLAAQRHQTRHLGLGDGDLAPAPAGERDIGNLVVGGSSHRRLLEIGG
jgi:hypothetical protein